jgi:electron transfer flavoprotein beta subunit
LKIIACIKQVPDSEAKVKAEGGQVNWGDAPLVINPFDEYAVEGALQQREAVSGSTVTALCIGPESAREALKHALAMGADEAVLVSDPALNELDTVGAARVLAAAIQKIGADMVVFGRQTLDTGSGLTAAQTARVLGWPMLGLAGQIKVDAQAGSVQVERVIEEGRQSVKANLPAVLSVVQSIGEPRYPSFMGIRKAGKATIPVWSLSDLGISAPAAVIKRSELLNPPARETTIDIITGDSPEAIAETLVEKILAEKVL